MTFSPLLRLPLVAFTLGGALAAENKPDVTKLPEVTVSAKVLLVREPDLKMTEARIGAAAVVAGDYVYVIGGSSTLTPAIKSIERFDPRTGRSERFAELQTGRSHAGAVAAGDKLYVFGGKTEGFATNTAANIIGEASPVPFSGIVPDDSVEVVDLSTRRVASGPPMPDARARFGCTLVGDKVYIVGGEKLEQDAFVVTNTVNVFDLATQAWTAGVPMPPEPRLANTLELRDLVLRFGGYNGHDQKADVVVFNPRKSVWTSLPAMTRALYAAPVFHGHYIFFFGDSDAPQTVFAYDLITKTSEDIDVSAYPARFVAAVAVGPRIYVFGGMAGETAPLDLIQVYSIPPPAAPR